MLIGGNNTAQNIITGNTPSASRSRALRQYQIVNNIVDLNVREGILVDGANGATGTQIGGTTLNVANTINSNGFEGVLIQNGANNTKIQGNTLNNNTREGITVSGTNNVLIGGPQGKPGTRSMATATAC